MKKFVYNMLLFHVLMTIVNCFFFYIVYQHYLKDYEQIEYSFTTYLLSDSHGLPLEKTKSESGFYNFSAGSDSYQDMRRKIRFLINQTDIKRLIISVDNHMLSPYRDQANNLDRSVFFANPDDFQNKYALVKERYIRRYIPLVNAKSRDIIKVFFKSTLKKEKPLNEWQALSQIEKKVKTQKRIAKQFTHQHSSEIQLSALQDIISLCKHHGIELIGLKYPLTQIYLLELNNLNYGADSVLSSEGLRVYDFSNLYRSNQELFRDQDHLDTIAGKLFTVEMLRAIN